jgi:hypothetical protein
MPRAQQMPDHRRAHQTGTAKTNFHFQASSGFRLSCADIITAPPRRGISGTRWVT